MSASVLAQVRAHVDPAAEPFWHPRDRELSESSAVVRRPSLSRRYDWVVIVTREDFGYSAVRYVAQGDQLGRAQRGVVVHTTAAVPNAVKRLLTVSAAECLVSVPQ